MIRRFSREPPGALYLKYQSTLPRRFLLCIAIIFLLHSRLLAIAGKEVGPLPAQPPIRTHATRRTTSRLGKRAKAGTQPTVSLALQVGAQVPGFRIPDPPYAAGLCAPLATVASFPQVCSHASKARLVTSHFRPSRIAGMIRFSSIATPVYVNLHIWFTKQKTLVLGRSVALRFLPEEYSRDRAALEVSAGGACSLCRAVGIVRVLYRIPKISQQARESEKADPNGRHPAVAGEPTQRVAPVGERRERVALPVYWPFPASLCRRS
jgi:hypothetical protein